MSYLVKVSFIIIPNRLYRAGTMCSTFDIESASGLKYGKKEYKSKYITKLDKDRQMNFFSHRQKKRIIIKKIPAYLLFLYVNIRNIYIGFPASLKNKWSHEIPYYCYKEQKKITIICKEYVRTKQHPFVNVYDICLYFPVYSVARCFLASCLCTVAS